MWSGTGDGLPAMGKEFWAPKFHVPNTLFATVVPVRIISNLALLPGHPAGMMNDGKEA